MVWPAQGLADATRQAASAHGSVVVVTGTVEPVVVEEVEPWRVVVVLDDEGRDVLDGPGEDVDVRPVDDVLLGEVDVLEDDDVELLDELDVGDELLVDVLDDELELVELDVDDDVELLDVLDVDDEVELLVDVPTSGTIVTTHLPPVAEMGCESVSNRERTPRSIWVSPLPAGVALNWTFATLTRPVGCVSDAELKAETIVDPLAKVAGFVVGLPPNSGASPPVIEPIVTALAG